jgi:hypothetical protein
MTTWTTCCILAIPCHDVSPGVGAFSSAVLKGSIGIRPSLSSGRAEHDIGLRRASCTCINALDIRAEILPSDQARVERQMATVDV